MKFKPKKNMTTLNQMSGLKLEDKFNVFYKFRFHVDYLKVNTNNKKISKKKSWLWFRENYKKKKFFAIKIDKKIIGLIIYNIKDFFYSIVIIKKYRNKGIGTDALEKLIKILKKKKLNLVTMVKKNNKNSIHIHKKLSESYKNKEDFVYFKLI